MAKNIYGQTVYGGPQGSMTGMDLLSAYGPAAPVTTGAAAGGPLMTGGRVNTGGVAGDISSYYTNLMENDPRMKGINANISGTIPKDVSTMLAQQAAERGIATGSPGSPNANSGLLRALGLTSLDLTNKGIGQYGDVLKSFPQLNTSDLFVTPAEAERNQVNLSLQRMGDEANLKRSREQLAQEATHFGINRADTLTGVAATGQKLDEIFNRNNAWGTGKSPATGKTIDPFDKTEANAKAKASEEAWYKQNSIPGDYRRDYVSPDEIYRQSSANSSSGGAPTGWSSNEQGYPQSYNESESYY